MSPAVLGLAFLTTAAFVAVPAAVATAQPPPDGAEAHVRFAPEMASPEVRLQQQRWIAEAGLRDGLAPRTAPLEAPAVEEAAGGVTVRLDGRFAQRATVGPLTASGTATPTCSGATAGASFAASPTVPPVPSAARTAAAPPLPSVATVGRNPQRLQGADAAGRVLVYAPDPVEGGSSISHWDRRAEPDLLMEPSISAGGDAVRLDVTPAMMEDLGWRRGGSTFVVISADFPDLGLHDPRPFAGAPGNPAPTLGEARRAVLEAVLAEWGRVLDSPVPIEVIVSFQELFCEEGLGAILAGAGPRNAYADVAGLPLSEPWYVTPLAESLVGVDLSGPPSITGGGDVSVAVNSFLDEGCLGPGSRWYYGLDNRAPENEIDLFGVLLHELGHGLGMISLTDPFSGFELGGRPTVFDLFLYDELLGETWPEMSDEERFWSARRHGRLAWTGERVREEAPRFLAPGAVELSVAAGPAAGDYPTVPTPLGDPVPDQLTAPLACATDAMGNVLDACSPLTSAVAGHLVLVDRDGCELQQKVRRVQAAGGVGVVLINSRSETQLRVLPIDGTEDVVIPVISVGRAEGLRLQQAVCPDVAPPLARGRFDVRAFWFTEQGAGEADVRALTADTLYASFFNPDNVELVVKTLDACALAGHERFWVFAAGLTNVGVEIRVTDTATGYAKRYTNALNDPFQPIQDTSAFATCEAGP